MKTEQTSPFVERLATPSSPSSSQRKDSAHLLFRVISLSPDSLREATCTPLIGRDFSRDIARGRETTGTFDSWYKPAKSRHCIIQDNLSAKAFSMKESAGILDSARFSRISAIQSYQQDSPESARSSRISKIPPNRQDSFESARLFRICSTPQIRRILAHGFPPMSHRPPQPATARGSQPGRVLHRQEAFRTSSRSWAIDRAGPEPFFSDSSLDVLCPFVDF